MLYTTGIQVHVYCYMYRYTGTGTGIQVQVHSRRVYWGTFLGICRICP